MKSKLNIKLDDFPFQHKIKTRCRDLDAFRHVNNATFLSYIDDARILFFKRWKINLKEKSLIVASVKIDYIKQVGHPSNMIIVQKDNLKNLAAQVLDFHNSISDRDFIKFQKDNRKLWEDYLSFPGFFNNLVNYLIKEIYNKTVD